MHTNSRTDQGGLPATTRNHRRQRPGLSSLEFIGCAIAVIGGAWLGALYLGVDVRHVAHTALSEADLLDKMPPNWRPPGPKDNAMTREQLVATLREELGVLRQELGTLRGGSPAASDTVADDTATNSGDRPPSAFQANKDKTMAYWSRINDIALGEAALQRDAESASNGTNVVRVFAIKGRISRFAAKSVEALPEDSVDTDVVKFGRQLALWFTHGGELYERAVQIWESSVANSGRDHLNQEWRRAEVQHGNEARLLYDKGVVVRNAVSRRFNHEFPEFAKPPAAGTTHGTTAAPAAQAEVSPSPAATVD